IIANPPLEGVYPQKLRSITYFFGLIALSFPLAHSQDVAAIQRTSWADYGGGADSSQYSGLTQVNRDNVAKLHVIWRFSTGDPNKYLFNPIVVHGVMYVLAKRNSIMA